MTDFLFSKPSFLEGMARVLDIGGTLDAYNSSADGAEADRRALQADWNAVGQDVWKAIEQAEKENKNKKI